MCMGFELLGVGGRPSWEWGEEDVAGTHSCLFSLLPVFSLCPGSCIFRASRVLGSISAQTQACWMTLDRSKPQCPHL